MYYICLWYIFLWFYVSLLGIFFLKVSKRFWDDWIFVFYERGLFVEDEEYIWLFWW